MESTSSESRSRVELIRAATEGNERAFERVVDLYANRLRWLIRMRLDPSIRARVSADDVLQDTMLVASKQIQRLVIENEGAFWRWLCRVVEDRLADARRRHVGAAKRDVRRERAATPSRAGMLRDVRRTPATPSAPMRGVERKEGLQRALGELPESFRDVIVLRVVEGFSVAETAQIMDRSPGAVRVLLSRALRRLGDGMADEECSR